MRRAASAVSSAGLLLLVLGCASVAIPEQTRPRVALAQGLVPTEGVGSYFCVVRSAERCLNARDDNCNGIVDEGCGLETGSVQFVIAWGEIAADVDLLVRDAGRATVEVGQVTEAGLTKDRDCPGKNGECAGRNREIVYLGPGAEPVPGAYEVTVRLDSLHGEDAPVWVELAIRLGRRTLQKRFSLSRVEEEKHYEFVL